MVSGMMQKVIYEDLERAFSSNVPWECLKGKSIMVTGAYGMIASYVVYMLIWLNEKKNYGINIIPVVRSKEKFINRFGEFANKDYMSICISSLTDKNIYTGHMDYIIHAASLASPQHYSVRPVDVLAPNVIGTYQLLELAKEKQIKGFLFFSSGAIYGTVKKAHDIEESDLGEMDPLNIQSCYGESKRMGETMCKAYKVQYGVPTKIARICHTYGPTMDFENDPRVFAAFVKNIIHGEDIIMKSDGSSKRAFCYIVDALTAIFTILLKGIDGEAYNVCNTSQFYSIKEFAQILVPLRTDKQINVIVHKREATENYTESPVQNEFPSSDCKLRELGWNPSCSVEEGFRRVIRAFGL